MWKIILFLLLFLSGCGGQFLWGHNDPLMQTNFDRENYDCEYKAKMYAETRATPNKGRNTAAIWGEATGNAITRAMDRIPEYNRCMKSKGYYQVNK